MKVSRYLRDRPFNLKGGGYGFLFRSEIFFCRAKREIFFQSLTLGYMTKTLNQISFFPPPKSEYFFRNIGNRNVFLEKKNIPPFKLNGRSLTVIFILVTVHTTPKSRFIMYLK